MGGIKENNHVNETRISRCIKTLYILMNFTLSIMQIYSILERNMTNTVNDYFVNMLEMGNEATNSELVYLSIPNLPSKYFS